MRKIKMEKKIPKTVQKYLSSVISGVKRQTPHFRASTAIKIFNGRKRPKSLPFSAAGHFFNLRRSRHRSHRHQEPGTAAGTGYKCSSATLDDIDRFLFENFRSLYGDNEGDDREAEEAVAEFNDAPSLFEIPAPEVADLCGSDRFFFTPVSSGSLIEEAQTRSEKAGFDFDSEKPIEDSISGSAKGTSCNFDDCVAVVTTSVSPYEDFLRSMEEVMKARSRDERRIDWDFMEELLFCFLRLNEKENYRFVLRAFVDLVMDLRRSSASGDRGGELVDAEWRERQSRLTG